MKNAGLHGRGEGGVQREKLEMSMTGEVQKKLSGPGIGPS